MRFTVNKEQRDFFQKKGWIEFEDLLKEEQIQAIQRPLEEVLAERLKVSTSQVGKQPAERLYHQGHDLWRSSPILQHFIMQPRFGEIAVELIGRKVLRLGYDQFFPPLHPPSLSSLPLSFYAPFMGRGLSLEEVSSIRGVACGMMIALGEKTGSVLQKEEASGEVSEGQKIDIFPFRAGHVIFFRPHLPVAWDCLAHHVGQRFYLIVYASSLSYYQLQPNDPHTHALKHLGYIFNDPLADKLNPVVYRP